jgi:hypothetical protein
MIFPQEVEVKMIVILLILAAAFAPVSAAGRYDLMKLRITDSKQVRTLERAGCVVNGPDRDGKMLVDVPYERIAELNRAGFALELVKPDIREFYRRNATDARYHTYTEIKDTFMLLAQNNPNICRFETLGRASNDSLLFALKITRNPDIAEDEPELMFEGAIHGDEKCGTEAVFAMAEYLVSNYGVDPLVTQLINTREIWIETPGNPYGHINDVRENANGVDCNRDYGYMWDGWGGSPAAFSQPESRLLAQLALRKAFNHWTEYHGGTTMISTPWSYSPFGARDSMEIQYLAQQWHNVTGYDYGPGYRVMYEIHGASKDYNYGAFGGYGQTVEDCIYKTPPAESLPQICLRERNAMLQELQLVNRGVRGIVSDSITGAPIRARVKPMPISYPSFCDSIGDYHRYLRPGTWTVKFEANGYRTKTISNVVVSDDTVTHLNVVLAPDTLQPVSLFRTIICDIKDENVIPSTPDAAFGLHDGQRSSLGQGGWAVFDFRQRIYNLPGNDFTVYEDDADPEGYSIQVANDWLGPWTTVGSDTGTASFDLGRVGVSSCRYLKVVDDGDASSGATAGFDLDAVEAIVGNVAALVYQQNVVMDSPPGGNGDGRLDPGETGDLIVALKNVGRLPAESVDAVLTTADALISVLDSAGVYGTIAPDSVRENRGDRFRVFAEYGCPRGHIATMKLKLTGTAYCESLQFPLVVSEPRTCDPTPENRGESWYWAFDNTDTAYPECPVSDWVEIHGVGTQLSLSDDQTVTLSLPPAFGPWIFYWQRFNVISVCSNGWIAAGSTTNSNWTNTSLPTTSMPGMVALNWDDLYPPTGNGVWYYHDTTNHRFIVEFDSVSYYPSGSGYDKFEFILYDSTFHAEHDNENCFEEQIRTANGFGSSTVGMQDPTGYIGIQYCFNGSYPNTAAPIVAGRAIRYAVIGCMDVAEAPLRSARCELRIAPNLIRTSARVSFSLSRAGPVRLALFDVSGRAVRELVRGYHDAGTSSFSLQPSSLSRGIYLLRLETDDATLTRKLIIQ